MNSLRLKLEKEILSWPKVTTKKMYGCPCYKYNDKLFAFLVTDGMVLTKASDQDKMKLSKEYTTKTLQSSNKNYEGLATNTS